jgi:hypothetical protein
VIRIPKVEIDQCSTYGILSMNTEACGGLD